MKILFTVRCKCALFMILILTIFYLKSRDLPRHQTSVSGVDIALPFPEQYSRRTDVDGYVFMSSCHTENITTSLEISYLHDFSPHVETAAQRRFLELRHDVDYCVWSPAVVNGASTQVRTMAFRVRRCLQRKPTGSDITLQLDFVFVQNYTADLKPVGPGFFIGYAYPPSPGRRNIDGPQDPRAFRLHGKTYLLFHVSVPATRRGDVTILRPALWNVEQERPIVLSLERNLMTDSAGHVNDKNWMPVIVNETLYLVQNLDPILVMSCAVVDGRCQYVHTADFSYVLNKGHDALRGGTPFVPYQGSYHIALAHCRFWVKQQRINFYTVHLILLDITTFKVVYISGHIPLHPGFYGGRTRPGRITTSFYFPTGLLVEDSDSLLVFAHVNDHSSCLFRLRGLSQAIENVISLYSSTKQTTPMPSGCMQELMYSNLGRYFMSLTRND